MDHICDSRIDQVKMIFFPSASSNLVLFRTRTRTHYTAGCDSHMRARADHASHAPSALWASALHAVVLECRGETESTEQCCAAGSGIQHQLYVSI